MRKLAGISRRVFGQSLGALAALTFIPKTGFAQSDVVEVKIKRFAFEPRSLTIRPGDSVLWTNLDSAPHTATSTEHKWDTGGLKKLQTGSIKFQQTGTFEYFCAYHPHMKGQILVVD